MAPIPGSLSFAQLEEMIMGLYAEHRNPTQKLLWFQKCHQALTSLEFIFTTLKARKMEARESPRSKEGMSSRQLLKLFYTSLSLKGKKVLLQIIIQSHPCQ